MAVVPGLALAGDLPEIVTPLDGGRFLPGETVLTAAPATDERAPSPHHLEVHSPELSEGERARAFLISVAAESFSSMEGLSFWVEGAGVPVHVDMVLEVVVPEVAARRYVSRVLLTNPLWHRVVLPLSEFYDPEKVGTYPIPRFDAQAGTEVRIGIELAGPQPEIRFGLDELGLTTWQEVTDELGWRTFMPPSHGFPPYLERFEGPLRWAAGSGATVAGIELEGFRYPRFTRGVAVSLDDADGFAWIDLDPEPLPYYEGFGMWIRGDGGEHGLVLTLSGDDGRPFTFHTPVHGKAWKLVFAAFENFYYEMTEEFEVDETETVRLTFSLATPAPARFEVGPMRLGYEK